MTNPVLRPKTKSYLEEQCEVAQQIRTFLMWQEWKSLSFCRTVSIQTDFTSVRHNDVLANQSGSHLISMHPIFTTKLYKKRRQSYSDWQSTLREVEL